jgi:DHA1 family tetracycline resistance protein-like MFS transporter
VSEGAARRRERSLTWLLFFVIVVDLIGFGMVIPILPFLSPSLGGSEADIALILASYSIAAAVAAPVWGRLSDRLGRRRILSVCLLGGAIAHALLAASDQLWMVYFARTMAGLASGSLPVATALIADNSQPARRARAMGVIGRAFGIGLILGPVVGGVLSFSESEFALPCQVAACLSLLAALMARILLPQDTPSGASSAKDSSSQKKPLSSWALVQQSRSKLFVCQFVLHTCAVSGAVYLFPLWVAAYLGWQAREVGLFFGLIGVAMLLTQGNFLGWLTERFGTIPVLRVAAMAFSLSLLASAGAREFWLMAGLGLSMFAAATLCLPILNSIASEAVPAGSRGQFLGVTASAAATGRILGPLLASTLLVRGGYSAAWLGDAFVVLLVVLWTILGAGRGIASTATVDPKTI